MVDAGEAGGTQRKQQMPPAKARKLLLRFPRDKNDANDNQQRTEDDQQCRSLAQDHDTESGAAHRRQPPSTRPRVSAPARRKAHAKPTRLPAGLPNWEQAAPDGSSKCHRRKLGCCCSDFHETRTMPMTTRKVPRMINSVVGSRTTSIAIVALLSATIGIVVLRETTTL